MEEILKKVEDFSGDEEILGAYDAEWHKMETERVVRLVNKEEAFEEGKEEGLQQGLKQGLKQGIEQGIERGSLKEKNEIARNMLKENINIEIISKVTGLNIEQIKKLESN